MRFRPIMFVGTCSDAGKSLVNTAFCRIFRQDGYAPAPFKAQNMSLNSCSTPEGGEIGRAQAVQAEACGLLPHTDMNPLLLKPSDERSCQVVLNGRPVGNMSAKEYFLNFKRDLFREVVEAYSRLANRYNPIVLEGAGSISELNLKERDITNMRMARETGAATYLVADIDRGGIFASVYGSIALLPPEERVLIKGIIVNKFRGDAELFREGRQILEKLTAVPVVGVLPFFSDIHIEAEDSVALDRKACTAVAGKINVAVVRLKRLSNFTDFHMLEHDPRFHVYYTDEIQELEKADILILPGTKNTIADLQFIRRRGIAEAVIRAYRTGRQVIGICGGYQMLGERVEDPYGVEGECREEEGLGLMPLLSVIQNDKTVCQSRFRYKETEDLCYGYQIHMGKTVLIAAHAEGENKPVVLNVLPDGTTDGYCLNNRCWGTYMHGILDNAAVLNDLAAACGCRETYVAGYTAFKERQYDKLAAEVRKFVDMEYIYSTLRID